MAKNRPDFDAVPTLADSIPHTPTKRRYGCLANGCPMPGSIFTHGHDQPGICAWHYGVQGIDMPRVTEALREWSCLAYEVREARRCLTDPDIAAKPDVIAERFAAAWERLESLVPGWEDKLRPGLTGKTGLSKGPETYGDWAKRLDAFLGGRVRDVLSKRVGSKA